MTTPPPPYQPPSSPDPSGNQPQSPYGSTPPPNPYGSAPPPNPYGGQPAQDPYPGQPQSNPPSFGNPAGQFPPQEPYFPPQDPPPYQPQTPQQPYPGYPSADYAQQMPGYGQPPAAPPNNNLVWAILSTVFCCVPLGIPAIVYSAQVNTKWGQGDYAGAQASATKAKNFALWGTISGAVVAFLYIIFVVVIGVLNY